MFLSIKGNGFSEYIFKEVSTITDHSKLYMNEVKYDEAKKNVTMIIDRYQLVSIDKKLFGAVEVPKYDKSRRIKSSILLKNVTSFKIDNNYNSNVNKTVIHRGIDVKDNSIYLCSAEEDQGKLMFSILLEVSDIDITISDL